MLNHLSNRFQESVCFTGTEKKKEMLSSLNTECEYCKKM